jgi:prephenate dehydrogenase
LRVGVVGVGLVGGSVALAARERLGAVVAGVDPDPRAADVLDLHVGGADGLRGADVVVVAAPLGALPGAVEATLAAVGPETTVTDVGSTKGDVVARCGSDPRFVGGHPLAGAEAAGVAHARADLFQDATWYLTPLPGTGGTHLERAHRFVSALGARPQIVEPADHDQAMAAVSHLPHVLANVLVEGARGPVGPSLRDAARTAGANPPLWAQIYAANRGALTEVLDAALERLRAARDLVAAGDLDALEAWQARAGEARRALLEAAGAGGPLAELRTSVPNRPGVVAEVALALSRAGVNISDMALHPSPDGSRGAIRLWVAADREAAAREVLAGLGLVVA